MMEDSSKINVDVLKDIIFGRVEPQIYAFSTETVPNYLKVGDTYRPIEVRLKEWRKHFPNLVKTFESVAKIDDETFFRDFAVHYFLEYELNRTRLNRQTFKKIPYYSNEFFENATEKDLLDAIKDIQSGYFNNESKYQYYRFDESHIPITHTYKRCENYPLRPNQEETVKRFKEAINKDRTNLLMYAVMRFGKSFTSMCCAVEMNAKLVVVVSAKADVKEEWKKTVESHIKFDGYYFLESISLLTSDTIIAEKQKANEKIVLFLTLQDLQGEEIKTKHKEVFENQIDLLLIDETHFGARASEYGKVLRSTDLKTKDLKNEEKLNDFSIDEIDKVEKAFNAKIRIHLSGTPYRILMDSEFTNDDIIAFYQFSNIAEDQKNWDLENLNKDEVKEWDNPYYGFPQMIRFAFNPNESSRKKMEELKKNGITYTFSELFKPQSITKDNKTNLHQKFIHEKEILDLLKVIDGSETDENLLSFLDYEKLKDGKMCRHIVCVLPYRASCDAFEELLKKNEFKNLNRYEIINISGVENENEFKDTKTSSGTQKVVEKIKKCERENKQTITLTVNRMLTGSTVPEWDTMLYLKDTASPQEYDQAIFRLQNQFIKVFKEPNGDVVKFNMKPQTLLVDFNPNRMFQMQEHKSQIYNVNTESNGNGKLEERIRKELEISPIVVLNHNKMVQIQPADILDAVRKYSSSRSVFDEATTISIDYSLLDIEAIKAEIERQNKISSRGGLEVKPAKGKGKDIETPTPPPLPPGGEETPNPIPTEKEEDLTNDYKGQFAMYYARILFFAFLTDSRVKSLQEIINHIKNNPDNLRIASNLCLEITILNLFQKHINPFILSELDYKIHNINSLANDTSISPIERASNAMKKFSRLSDSEIVTPEFITDKMIEGLPENAIDENTMLLDIASKQGEFVYAVYKKFGKEIANHFYSIPTSKIAYEFTRKVYKLLDLDMTNIEASYTSYDLIDEGKKDQIIENETIKINNQKMKFNIIVGNPPYQESDGGGMGSSALPLYQKFVYVAKQHQPSFFSMIIPSRWFTGGRGLDEFRDEMLNDKRIKNLTDYLNSKDCFPDVDLKGGVCYFLWDKSYEGKTNVSTIEKGSLISNTKRDLLEKGAETFIRYNEAISILHKVQKFNEKSFADIISANDPFGFDTREDGGYKRIKPKFKTTLFDNAVKFYYNGWQKSGVGYVEKQNIRKNIELINGYKVLITKAWGTGNISKDWLNPLVVEPNSCCTETYLMIGPFEKIEIANNVVSYTQTKFFHFLVSLIKLTQNAMKKVYTFVPLQNFSSGSDIDWNKSTQEIDQQLYAKYNLSQEEIEFIEEMIKPMD